MSDDAYADVGRALLAGECWEAAEQVQQALFLASAAAQDGAVTAEEVRRCESAIELAEGVLDDLARAARYDRPLSMQDLDSEQLEQVLE